jgi:hypothetical protein
MGAQLRLQLAAPYIEGIDLSPEGQAKLFGFPFERLSQGRRVHILHALRLIDDDQLRAAEQVGRNRNAYVHDLKRPDSRAEEVARDTLLATEQFVCPIICMPQDGTVLIPPPQWERLLAEANDEPHG